MRDRFQTLGWLEPDTSRSDDATTSRPCDLTPSGAKAFAALGIDVEAARTLRRRFAYACVDWSERRPHLGGALAAALLTVALKRKWMLQDLDSRALRVTSFGRREMMARFGLHL